MKKAKAKISSGLCGPLAIAQAATIDQFAKLVRRDLAPVLGAAGLRQVRFDTAIATTVGGGVVAYAGMRSPRPMTLDRIRKESPVVAVLANSIPLIDRVALRALPPGVYALRLRPLGGDSMAFDFLAAKGHPAFSTGATTVVARQQGGSNEPITKGIDIDFGWPGPGGDPLWPPPENGFMCISYGDWKKCWHWGWPEINWPDWF
jgi:hypothetical protein